jgi:hypothetical protein
MHNKFKFVNVKDAGLTLAALTFGKRLTASRTRAVTSSLFKNDFCAEPTAIKTIKMRKKSEWQWSRKYERKIKQIRTAVASASGLGGEHAHRHGGRADCVTQKTLSEGHPRIGGKRVWSDNNNSQSLT